MDANRFRTRPAQGLTVTRPDGAVVCCKVWRAIERGDDEPAPAHPPRPVLVLDGIGCSGWGFRRIIPRWAMHRDVVLMHYRGHGMSPNPPRPWRLGMDVLADDAAAIMDRAALVRPIVVGFSMGFVVALELARQHPGVAAGLVSIAGPHGRVLSNFQGSSAMAQALPLALATTRLAGRLAGRLWRAVTPSELSRSLGLRSGQLNLARLDASDYDIYMHQLAATNPELFLTMLEHAHACDASDRLASIELPSLIIAGAADSFVPLAGLREMAMTIPGAELSVYPDASHALPAEYPAEIAERVSRFARERCDPPDRGASTGDTAKDDTAKGDTAKGDTT